MAISHCSVKIIGRSKGKSVIAAAAYRAGEKLYDRETGLTHDFTRKGGVAHRDIKVREFCSFGYDQKYVDIAQECADKENGKINLYYGASLVLFVAYDRTACWIHPQSGESSGATDATIVATHMMLEAASIDLGTVWISYFDEGNHSERVEIKEMIKN